MISELKPEVRNKAKGIDALLFEFEAPVIICPSIDNKNHPSSARVPDWLLGRIRYERLERKGDDELATPSELVAYLMTAYDYIRLEMDLMNVYKKYFSDIIRRMNNPITEGINLKLEPRERLLANELRGWIYQQQISFYD